MVISSVSSVSWRLALCDSPYVLVLYITTTPTQKQALTPKIFAGALQAHVANIPQPGANMVLSYCLYSELLLHMALWPPAGCAGGSLSSEPASPTCVKAPAALPKFTPPRELLAQQRVRTPDSAK